MKASGLVANRLLLPSIPKRVYHKEIVNLYMDKAKYNPAIGMDKA